MNYSKWIEAATASLTPTDIALVKWCCIGFGVLLAQKSKSVRDLDSRLVGAAVAALAVKPLVTALGCCERCGK
jgi:hypothetical protein